MARWEGFGEERGNYVLMTMHRQAGVDDPVVFGGVIDALDKVQARLPVVFSLHPRTAKMLDEFDLRGQLDAMKAVQLMSPLSYLEFMSMMIGSRLVITDSGGIQEETTALGVPCLTIRWNTERPVTVTRGTNRLVGLDSKSIVQVFEQMMADQNEKMLVPELWDGKSADRVLNVLMKDVGVESSW
jgi:UDP-N-acetylglucosamine 2-epimerase (non-hydrolysing)